MARPHLLIGLAAAVCIAGPVLAQIAVRNQGYIPYSEAPINYRSQPLSDPVALLEKDIEAGKTGLTYEPEHGYLKSVLALLKVPVESQTLVFSKTSFQYPKISPQHPRALYYNDDVYVGKVHDGNAIEIVSFDPKQGAIFYLVDERKVDKTGVPARRAGLHPMPHRGRNARRAGRVAALGLSDRDRHADAAEPVLHHRPGEPAETALGRLVRQWQSRQSIDGQRYHGRASKRPGADGCVDRCATVAGAQPARREAVRSRGLSCAWQ